MSQSKLSLIAGILILTTSLTLSADCTATTQRPIQTPVEVVTAPTVPSRYIKLRNLLAAGRWKEADAETARVMLVVAKREKEGWLDDDSIKKFSCSDLSTIDQLWVKYSNGRFGFSVQSRIYKSLGGTDSFNESVWRAYGDRIGWRVNNNWLNYDQLTFDLETSKIGHLPASGGIGWRGLGLAGLLSRESHCVL